MICNSRLPLEIAGDRDRGGVTLTEVLMSLLIMSIGVVSLVTLFPISTMRVIEATNMTNSTVLRYNAEAIIDAQPNLIFDPDGNPSTRHLGQSFVVDPLGYMVSQATGGTPGVFGYNAPGSVTIPMPTRYLGDPGITTENMARTLVSASDTYTEQGDGRAAPGTATPTSVTLDPNVDLSALAGINLATTEVRAFIFDPLGDRSEMRSLTTISQPAPHALTWTTPLPASFTDIGRVMVATGEEYYTWMLTVHRSASGPAKVDVVVFVKRLLTQEAEQVYAAKLVPFVPGTTNENNAVTVTFSDDGRRIRRGGYLFDTKNCRWYRISSVASSTATTKSLVLEESIRRANTEDLNLDGALSAGEDVNSNNQLDEGGVIAFPNVVGVFPLELKVP